MPIKKILKILLQPSELIYDEMMKDLIKQSWDTPITIVKVYNFLKSKIDEIAQNEVKTMKMLLLLHAFIFKGSQNTLIVFLKDGTDQNSVNLLLEIILKSFSNRKESIIFKYAYFIYIKFNLHLKNIKVLQNNFSVTKIDLIHNYENLLSPKVFSDLFSFLKFSFTMFLSLRKFWFDYFFKNFIVSFYKELLGLMGLLSNMTIYLLFGLNILEGNNDLPNKVRNDISEMLDEFLELFDFMAMAMNIYVEQVRRLKFENFGFFKIKKNLPETFEQVKLKMKQKIEETSEEVNTKFFSMNFLNNLLRMNEANGSITNPTELNKDIPSSKVKSTFVAILTKLSENRSSFKNLLIGIGKTVPKCRFWYEQNVKLITKGLFTNQGDLNTNMVESGVIQNKINANQGQIKDMGTQTEPVKIPRPDKPMTPEEIEKNNKRVDEKLKIGKNVKNTGSGGNELEEDIIINGININNFILDEFKRTLDAWIIDFSELKFDELIASGSTCQVHKGMYKNMKVAIKKLLTPGNEKKIKFMKEFKRELSLLISLPHHPNLLTLMGFCIKGNNIYLVTEFCEGGTLFDILYRNQLEVKLTFKQKVKILLDVTRGMQFLHQLKRQIIHRDLKSLNILIDRKIVKGSLNFQAKIADFGLARSFENPEEFITKRMGTFHWMAPEIFSDKPYTTKTDVYAFSIILWEIFAEKTPYYHLDIPTKIIKYVYYDNGRPFIEECKFEERFKKDMIELIKINWDKNDVNRQEFDEIYGVLDRIYQNC